MRYVRFALVIVAAASFALFCCALLALCDHGPDPDVEGREIVTSVALGSLSAILLCRFALSEGLIERVGNFLMAGAALAALILYLR